MSDDVETIRENATERVFNYLYERQGQWVPAWEFCTPEVGGLEGTRRARELDENGITVERRKMKTSTAWEYRLP